MKFTRRDLLVWGAGAAAGLMVTPVPWKVLDDVSIWSQNWPWIPQPARGPVETRTSFCTLCPKGCGLRVRMAAGWPVGVAGLSTHPVSRGALCPLAFGAHQLNWHPRRHKKVRHGASESSWAAAQAAFAKACREGSVAVIDGYPGRAASSVLASFAEKHGGSYRVVPGPESRSLLPYESWSGVPADSLGYDFEHANTILSFGARLLDGWGVPGRFTRLWAERAAGNKDPHLRLIQVEPTLSRTAARAWQWTPIHEGSDSALAAGLACALLEQKLVPAHGPIPPLSLAEACVRTGLAEEIIRGMARTIVARTPVVVISRDNDPAIAALNVLLGAVGTRGGIIRNSVNTRRSIPAESNISNVRALVVDSSVPWDFVPQTGAEVFRFAAWDGGSTHADWLLPAPGFLEEATDIPTAPGSASETYSIAANLVRPIAEAQGAAQFLINFDPSLPSTKQVIHARCEDLFRRRVGIVYGQETIPTSRFASAQRLEEQLSAGAVWVGEQPRPGALHCRMEEWPIDAPPNPADNWSHEWQTPVLPPLASKLYIESALREAPDGRSA
jgi:hypothetical protein